MGETGHEGTDAVADADTGGTAGGAGSAGADVVEPAQARSPEIEADLSVLGDIAGELDGIEAALGRIDDRSYGRCTACGVAIEDGEMEQTPLLTACAAHR